MNTLIEFLKTILFFYKKIYDRLSNFNKLKQNVTEPIYNPLTFFSSPTDLNVMKNKEIKNSLFIKFVKNTTKH